MWSSFQHNVKNDTIVLWVMLMLMRKPICNCAMDFHVSDKSGGPDLDFGFGKIRTAVEVQPSDLDHLEHSAVTSPKPRFVEVLSAPDVEEKSLVNVLGMVGHRCQIMKKCENAGCAADCVQYVNCVNRMQAWDSSRGFSSVLQA
jgi:hypothetical protein